MEIIENEKKFNSNYKKLIWILIIFNIIFLLAIFGLNYACYNALETKCEDNIQLSVNTSKQDKKQRFNNINLFVSNINDLGYPNYYYTSTNEEEISDFLFSDHYLVDFNINLKGYYNFYAFIFLDFEYINYVSSNTEPFLGFYDFNYDTYLDNGNNLVLSDPLYPFFYQSGEFWNSEGDYRFNTSSVLSSIYNSRFTSLYYDTSNNNNDYYFYIDFNQTNFTITQYNKIEFLIYFEPYGDSSELGNYQNGYDKGYQDGLNNADVYEYAQEYYNNGFNAGYQEGIQKGIEESGNNILGNMLLSIFDVPLMYLSSLLNFNLLGINLLGLLGAILCIGLIAFLIKKLL